MAVEGVDYSWGRPDVAELARLGKRFAVRYVSWSTSGKNITRSEAEALTQAGLAVVTNWEYTARDQLAGRAGGVRDAAEADRLHRAAGGPVDRPIYFSTDFDATAGELATCYDYLRGVAEVLGWGRVGVYGGYRTIAYMQQRGVRWLWQTFAWSGGRWHPAAQLQQYRNGVQLAGADVDLDRALAADYGQWTLEEDEMSRRDAMLGVYDALHLAANKTAGDEWENTTARAIRNNLWKVVRPAVAAELAEVEGQVAGLTVLVQQLLVAPPVPVTADQLAELVAAVRAGAAEGAQAGSARVEAALAAAGQELAELAGDPAGPADPA